ncbi:MAG: peptidase M20, partial [Cyclobacteriaceae bacterium]|nr:peptidase M20 [Cyclobacteriaceae bacterium]
MKFVMLFLVFAFTVQSALGQDEIKATAQASFQRDIEKLANQKNMQDAFSIIDALEPTTRKDLIELTEIPSPPFMEQRRAERFKQMLQEAGADKVWIDEVGNVLALRKGKDNRRTVVLNAHIDTV